LIESIAASRREPKVAAVLRDSIGEREAQLAELIRHGQATGEIGDVDADSFAITFAVLLDGLSIQVALKDPVVDPDRAFAIAMSFAAGELDVSWKPRRRSARLGNS